MPYPFKNEGAFTGSINSGSYFSKNNDDLFGKGFVRDFWYGFSPFDALEFSLFDFSKNQLFWETVEPESKKIKLSYSYENEKNEIVNYSYDQFVNDIILYKNDKILNPIVKRLQTVGISQGEFLASYNYIRQVAGGPNSFLYIKDISPSRKEIKISSPLANDLRFKAFCEKRFQVKDVSALVLQTTDQCPYDSIYRNLKPENEDVIEFIKSIFFLPTDGDFLRFLKNLYEDYVRYVPLTQENVNLGESPGRVERIQGIRSYFQNWVRSNNDGISDFSEIESKFSEYVTLRLNTQFKPYAVQRGLEFVQANKFLFEFFVNSFYKNSMDPLRDNHTEKYFSYLKNALNFGDNNIIPILNHRSLSENGETILLVKLVEELPTNIQILDRLWITNIGMTPFVFNVTVRSSDNSLTIKIGPPNFSVKPDDIGFKNSNNSYTMDDLDSQTDGKDDEITIQKKISDISVDYSDFENFVIFSSAAQRLTVFKNKMIQWCTLNDSLNNLLSISSNQYPQHTDEVDSIKNQMTEIVSSFDGYESYLFDKGDHIYDSTSGEWNNSDAVDELDAAALKYDKSNDDSLLTNTPYHIVSQEDNEEYLKFLMMVGHFFDNIQLYISHLPIERSAKNQLDDNMSLNTIKNMLYSFGWNVEDILGDESQISAFLNSETGGSNEISDVNRMRNIWNRLLITLPQIYKTKGTEESIRLILACHGIPDGILSVREYGGINYSISERTTALEHQKVFMMKYQSDVTGSNYSKLPWPGDAQTLEFKFCIPDETNYLRGGKYPLVANFNNYYSSGFGHLGWWNIHLERGYGEFDGKIVFDIIPYSSSVISSPGTKMSLTSSYLPVFNGDIFSVMLRRNDVADIFISSSVNEDTYPIQYDLVVQKNTAGREVFNSYSSFILENKYNEAWSLYTGSAASCSYLKVGNPSSDRYSGSFIHNKFEGLLDKILIWKVAISDDDFEDHVNDINSYSWSGSLSDELHKNLYFNSNIDFPIDTSDIDFATGSANFGVTYYYNYNEYYRAPYSWNTTISPVDSSSQQYMPWIPVRIDRFETGSAAFVYNSKWDSVSHSINADGCTYSTFSVYPFQFREVNFEQAYPFGRFGPNRFKNNKIKKSEFSLQTRLDNLYSSVYPSDQIVSSDSNVFGIFLDPQDSKNKDAVHYIGHSGIIEAIADPESLYSSSYSELESIRNIYGSGGDRKVLFNEIISLSKFYLNKSVFKTIQKVAPARANTLTGVLIEPSIIERPKYKHQPIISDAVSAEQYLGEIQNIYEIGCESNWVDSVKDETQIPRAFDDSVYEMVDKKNNDASFNTIGLFDDMASRGEIVLYNGFYYVIDDYQRLVRTNSNPSNRTINLDIPGVGLPTVQYPVNYSHFSVDDISDDYQLGWYADMELKLSAGATGQYDYDTNRSGSSVFYLLKRWKRHDIFQKNGPHLQTDIPSENLYATASVFLYDLMHVSENFYKNLVYSTNLDAREVSDSIPTSIYTAGYGYSHLKNTFVSSSNSPYSNVKAYVLPGGLPTDIEYYLESGDYFEIFTGYPRNHYTHKKMLMSPTRDKTEENGESVYFKGRQTSETTIGSDGLGDDSLPVQSTNVSNVNVVSGDNVLG